VAETNSLEVDVEDESTVVDDEPTSDGRSDEEDLELWLQYKQCQDESIRERLILKYASFVKYVAGRMAINLPSNVDYDDLVSYGIFGLMDAIEKFDPDRAIKFKTYAKTRIRGAILDELRVLDWTPRSIRQKSKQLERAYAELESQLGREASDDEICEFMNITKKDLHKMFDESKQSLMISLDEGDGDGEGGSSRMDFQDSKLAHPESTAEEAELRKLLAQEIAKLSERERLVITLYYFEKLTSKEIGRILGVSDSRISQLHTKAVTRLRGKLARLQELLGCAVAANKNPSSVPILVPYGHLRKIAARLHGAVRPLVRHRHRSHAAVPFAVRRRTGGPARPSAAGRRRARATGSPSPAGLGRSDSRAACRTGHGR